MPHIPHLFVPPIWTEADLPLTPGQIGHLRKVLRRDDRSEVTYTDGAGVLGRGKLVGDRIARESEKTQTRGAHPARLAVAPPRSRDRVRMIVEKLSELGVAELIWLRTAYTQGRPPECSKARSWAVAALEQSRGAWLMDLSGPKALSELGGTVVVADPDAEVSMGEGVVPDVLAIGPEGGWNPEELPDSAVKVRLSDRILRTETAAIIGAARLLAD